MHTWWHYICVPFFSRIPGVSLHQQSLTKLPLDHWRWLSSQQSCWVAFALMRAQIRRKWTRKDQRMKWVHMSGPECSTISIQGTGDQGQCGQSESNALLAKGRANWISMASNGKLVPTNTVCSRDGTWTKWSPLGKQRCFSVSPKSVNFGD